MRPSAARCATCLLAVALSYISQDVALRLVLTLTPAAPSPPAVALVKALIQAAAFAPALLFFEARRRRAAVVRVARPRGRARGVQRIPCSRAPKRTSRGEGRVFTSVV